MPDPNVALSDSHRSADADAAPVAESPDRRAPVVQTPDGEPSPTVSAFESTHSARSFERFAIREAAENERFEQSFADVGDANATSPRAPSEPLDATLARAQNARRVQEFSAEAHGGRNVREWDGAEHQGVVVAADARGVTMHVGRNEYMRIPTPGDRDVVGSFAAVDRSGKVSPHEVGSHERSRGDVERGGR